MTGIREAGRPTVSVVIPAHDAEGTLGQQLDALTAQRGAPAFEVVVVANRCTDGTVALARSFADRLDLVVVVADEIASPAYARDAGSRVAAGALLLYCDADDAVAERWVAEMCAALTTADLVGGRLIPMEPYDAWALRCSVLPVDTLPMLDSGLRYAVSASMGCRRELHERIGWDTRFGAAFDDVAFSLAAQRAGFRIGFAADAVCHYRLRSGFASVVRQKLAYGRGLARLARVAGVPRDDGPVVDVARLCVGALRRAFRVRSSDDLRVACADVAYLWGFTNEKLRPGRGGDRQLTLVDTVVLAAGRRSGRIGRSARHRRALGGLGPVDVTVPPGFPVLGGVGLRVPAESARRVARAGPVHRDVVGVVEDVARRSRSVVTVGGWGAAALVATSAVRDGRKRPVLVWVESDAAAAVAATNLERSAPGGSWTVARGRAPAGWVAAGEAFGVVLVVIEGGQGDVVDAELVDAIVGAARGPSTLGVSIVAPASAERDASRLGAAIGDREVGVELRLVEGA